MLRILGTNEQATGLRSVHRARRPCTSDMNVLWDGVRHFMQLRWLLRWCVNIWKDMCPYTPSLMILVKSAPALLPLTPGPWQFQTLFLIKRLIHPNYLVMSYTAAMPNSCYFACCLRSFSARSTRQAVSQSNRRVVGGTDTGTHCRNILSVK